LGFEITTIDKTFFLIAGAVPTLNLTDGEKTEKAQQILQLQQEADQVNIAGSINKIKIKNRQSNHELFFCLRPLCHIVSSFVRTTT
jgi:hypothetical protein